MLNFLRKLFFKSRFEISNRDKVLVREQVALLVNDSSKLKLIVNGWNFVASCYEIDPNKLRTNDTIRVLNSLDWTSGDMSLEIDLLLSDIVDAPFSDDAELIVLAEIVGKALNAKIIQVK